MEAGLDIADCALYALSAGGSVHLIQHLTTVQILQVVRSGAGITVSALNFSVDELAAMARALNGSAVLHVVDCQELPLPELNMIARSSKEPAYVMFSGPSNAARPDESWF